VAFGYALVRLYWALGGHGLISTVGGYAEHLAGPGGRLAVLVALAVVVVKAPAGVLALALVQPNRRGIPRRCLLVVSAGTSGLLLRWHVVSHLGATLAPLLGRWPLARSGR
jgi:hypothetical protein